MQQFDNQKIDANFFKGLLGSLVGNLFGGWGQMFSCLSEICGGLQYYSKDYTVFGSWKKQCIILKTVHHEGHALGIWICGCSLFYKRELWVTKSAGAQILKASKSASTKGDVPKICKFVHPLHPC